ncbi:MAG: hypothetical protein R2867_21445 [Caldilineaceae bacterium]
MLILDISDPQAVQEVGDWTTPNGAAATIVTGGDDLLYLAVGRAEPLGGPYLEMLDIATATAPRRLGSYAPAAYFIQALYHRADQPELYVSERAGPDPALTILDGSIPGEGEPALSVLNRITTTLPTEIIAGPNNHLILNGADGIAIWRGGVPPTPVGTLALAGATGMAYRSNHLYRLDGHGGLQIIDLTAPAQPTLVTTVEGFPSAGLMAQDAFHGRLYLSKSHSTFAPGGGVLAYDLVDPLLPTASGHYLEAGLHPSGFDRQGARLLLTSLDVGDGLRILRDVRTAILELAADFDIELNGQQLREGDFQEVSDAFVLRMTDLAAAATLRGKCTETLIGLIRLEAELAGLDVPFNAFDLFVDMLAARDSELCNQATVAAQQDGSTPVVARIELRMNEGGLRFRPQAVGLLLTATTPVAQASGRGQPDFTLRHDPTAERTTIAVTSGSVTLTPLNPALPPVTVPAGYAVDVTQDAISAIRREGELVFLPVVVR